ncbi:MAG TPA: SpoIIE family protein phosphatase [Terriglobales bacterium]|jgi:serine phosphatase RsbU (regulator of sigma subunit)|nr:SpoIIE family protein phosphatase [Terriglobales bacterium]
MKGLLSKLGFGSAVAEPTQLVHETSPDLTGAELAVAYFSGRAGGDFYEFLRVSPNRTLFGLLDLAGKRETSRTVLDAAQASFRASGAELFSDPELNEAEAMVELARRLNLEIMRAAGGVRSCPAFAGCYNEELGTVCYVNAGHTPGLLYDQCSIEELPATGLPLGLFSLAPTDARIVGLGPEGALAIVSRGVVEAQCADEEFGLNGVKLVLGGNPPSATQLSRGILEQVQSFLCTVPKHNDVTALSLKRAA